jgi:hypothetical protein
MLWLTKWNAAVMRKDAAVEARESARRDADTLYSVARERLGQWMLTGIPAWEIPAREGSPLVFSGAVADAVRDFLRGRARYHQADADVVAAYDAMAVLRDSR